MPHQQFKEEVEKYLTGASEASELIYFKVYKSRVPVLEQALETAARMLGSDKSRGYCLEMICADFLAGANLENGNADVLLTSLRRSFAFLSAAHQQQFLRDIRDRHEWRLEKTMATADVDIFVMLPTTPGTSLLSLAPIYAYLTAYGCRPEGERIIVGDWPVQFLPPRGTMEHEALADAVEAEVEGVRTWVLTAEHLVAIALQTGRAKDHARIVQFFEADAVDADKLNGILSRHGLLLKWEKFQRKYLEE